MSHYLISPVSVVSKWPGPVVTECRQIDLISDTQDWNETTGNWALTGPGPFLERNMKKQTSSAGHKPTRNYLSWAGRPLSVVLTRPRHTLTCIHIFLFLITFQFVITHFDICLHCINCWWKQIWLREIFVVCLCVRWRRDSEPPGWWPRHKVALPPSKLSLLYLQPCRPDS